MSATAGELVDTLVLACERAAAIARICREVGRQTCNPWSLSSSVLTRCYNEGCRAARAADGAQARPRARRHLGLGVFVARVRGRACSAAVQITDFKTLADVLMQQAIVATLAAQFPALADHIQGEEDGTVHAADGRLLTLAVGPGLADQLHAVLPQHPRVVEQLVAAATRFFVFIFTNVLF